MNSYSMSFRWFLWLMMVAVATTVIPKSIAYLPILSLLKAHPYHDQRSLKKYPSLLQSSTSASSSSEADFSAFANSLEMEDEDFDDVGLTTASSSSTTSKSFSSSSSSFGATTNTKEKPWQAKLDELVDPMTSIAQRQILLSELFNANEKIQESVMDALTNRKIDPLLTPTQRKLQDGTRAVVRQLANDILPQLQKSAEDVVNNNRRPPPQQPPTSTGRNSSSSRSASSSSSLSSLLPFAPPTPSDMESIGNRLFSVLSNQMERTFRDLQEDLSDPFTKIPQRLEKQRTEVLQEARNVFLETPEGLQEPPYSMVESCELYEIRDYDAYSVASTSVSTTTTTGMDTTTSMDGVAAGQAFNVLAAYLFGGNEEQTQMSMTTPVTTTSTGEMRFYLAPMAGGTSSGFPKPTSSTTRNNNNNVLHVDIVDVPPARLAVRKFTGFVTDGEVARQKDTLLQALEMDGVELDVPHGAIVPHVIFQYNPPYTLPMVRRNEIAVPVRKVVDAFAPITTLQEEWNVVDMDDDEDVADGNVNGLK